MSKLAHLTYDAFIKQVSSDLVKANEFEAPCALALIQIDDFLEERSLFETDPFPKVLASINQSIKSEITPLNILGRLGEKLFACYFFNSSTKDVFLWAEKLRIKIARKPISVVSKQTTFTVSIGVASALQKTDVEDVLKNAELALNKAYQKGGNTVKSIKLESNKLNNFLLIILDGVGIGELPDAEKYGDKGSNTLGNISKLHGWFRFA